MSITNLAKPVNSLTNATRVSSGVTWDTWTVAWQDETRTWDELASLMDNFSKPSAAITNTAKPA